jgi:hypothetical protein
VSGVLVPVVDAVLALLPLPAGFAADDGATEPTLPKPRRLYAWPRRLSPQRVEEADGRFDEAGVRLRVLYTVGARGEPRVQRSDRAVTLALDAIVPDVVAAVAANRRGELWWDLFIETVVPDAVRTADVRGIGFDLVVRMEPAP